MGDVTNDGRVDVVVFGAAPAQHTVAVNSGGGVFVVNAALSAALSALAFVGVTDASVGDVDNDGRLDVFVTSSVRMQSWLLLNNGSGVFVAPPPSSPLYAWYGVFVTGAPVLVDVNGDGALDVPAAGLLHPVVNATSRRNLYVTLVGRNRRWNQHGAVVCVTPTTATPPTPTCRVVDGGGGSGQTPYTLAVGVANASWVYDVDVVFVGGHAHNRSTAAAFGSVAVTGSAVVLRDVPAIRSVVVAPTVGRLVAGDSVNVTVTAQWGESTLVPSPDTTACCFVNGVNVRSSFQSVGGGVYTLSYVVSPGDSDVFLSPPMTRIALVDAHFVDAASDSAGVALTSASWTQFSIDTHPPAVTLTCGSWNDTVRPTNYELLCVSCGIATNESALGCTVHYTLNDDPTVRTAVSTSKITGTVRGR